MQPVFRKATNLSAVFFHSPLCIALAASVPLFVIQHKLWWVMGICVWAAAELPKIKFLLLAGINAYFWIFSNTILPQENISAIYRMLNSSAIPAFVIRFVAFALLALSLVVCFRLVSLRIRIFAPIIVAVLYLGLVLLSSQVAHESTYWIFTAMLVGMISRSFLYVILILRQPKLRLWDLLYIQPFWATGMPVPGTFSDLSSSESMEKSSEVRARGLFLIFSSSALLIVSGIMKRVLLSDYRLNLSFLPDLPVIYHVPVIPIYSIPKFISDGHIFDVIFAPILRYAVFFFDYLGMFGLQVGFLKAMGFAVPENAVAPWRATGFYDFLKRVQGYYNRIVVDCFVVPLFSVLGFVRNFALRTGLSVFLAVAVFGMLTQIFVSNGGRFLVTRINEATLGSLSLMLVYYMILGLLVAVSFVLQGERLGRDADTEKAGSGSLSFFYYCTLAIIAYYFLFNAYGLNPGLSSPYSGAIGVKNLFSIH